MFEAFQYRRLAGIIILVLAGFVWLGFRLHEIQIRRHQELTFKAQRFSRSERVLEAWRGEIRDRSGRILAMSVPMKTVYANPASCSNRLEQVARTCGPLLQIPADELAGRLRAFLQRPASGGAQKALVLKRNVPVSEWQTIASALNLETFGLDKAKLSSAEQAELHKLRHRFLFSRDTQVRVYPYGECLSRVLGFASVQTNGSSLRGMCGIERTFDQALAGEDGQCVSEQDCAGNELPLRRSAYKPARDGADVVLTIDLRLQQILEESLLAGLRQSRARRASGMIMDPRTFEILALACLPNFNPQNPGASPPETWRNPVVNDMVEPGSTFKIVALAAALEQRAVTLESGVYCEQGDFVVNRVSVHDHAPYGLLTVRQCFAKSSNIGFAKIGLLLGPQRFYNSMTNFGFGQCTGVPFVGETPGLIGPRRTWSTMALTRAAFGQGVGVSELQMAVAFCAIANDGRLLRPLLVNRIEPGQGQAPQRFQPQFVRQVVPPQTAHELKEALKAVASREGTGAAAAMDLYTAAVKTGTAQKSNERGYLKGCYYSSVIGFFPADTPQVLISVALDEPQNGYYASAVVAPVFHSIAEQVGACLGIPPDKMSRRPAASLAQQTTPAAAPPLLPVSMHLANIRARRSRVDDGVRPSSGATTPGRLSASPSSPAIRPSSSAAPEDGRTPGTPGKPSSGAATPERLSASPSSRAIRPSSTAAPEDGRTPGTPGKPSQPANKLDYNSSKPTTLASASSP